MSPAIGIKYQLSSTEVLTMSLPPIFSTAQVNALFGIVSNLIGITSKRRKLHFLQSASPNSLYCAGGILVATCCGIEEHPTDNTKRPINTNRLFLISTSWLYFLINLSQGCILNNRLHSI